MPSDWRTTPAILALGMLLAASAPAAFAQGADRLANLGDAYNAPPVDDAPVIAPTEPQGRRPAGVAERLITWINVTDDNGALPFMIVDKPGARIFAFGADGQFLGSAPVLLGLARGDDSAPGIGDLKLAQISDDQRTTPAGRFVASFGPSEGHGTMLWVDPADAIAMHPVMSVNAGEHRLTRIKSQDPSQHRISYGCINVPASFYNGVVLPALAGGPAIVYVLPDTKPINAVFPAFAAANIDAAPRNDPTDANRPSVPDPETARLEWDRLSSRLSQRVGSGPEHAAERSAGP